MPLTTQGGMQGQQQLTEQVGIPPEIAGLIQTLAGFASPFTGTTAAASAGQPSQPSMSGNVLGVMGMLLPMLGMLGKGRGRAGFDLPQSLQRLLRVQAGEGEMLGGGTPPAQTNLEVLKQMTQARAPAGGWGPDEPGMTQSTFDTVRRLVGSLRAWGREADIPEEFMAQHLQRSDIGMLLDKTAEIADKGDTRPFVTSVLRKLFGEAAHGFNSRDITSAIEAGLITPAGGGSGAKAVYKLQEGPAVEALKQQILQSYAAYQRQL